VTSPPTRDLGRRPGHLHEDGTPRQGEGVSKVKAVLLLVVAVLLGIGMLKVDRGPGRPASAAGATTQTTTSTSTTTTTAPPVSPSAAVKVLVANGGTVNGAATFFTNKLSKAGWGTLPPTTTSTTAAASAVYYASGQQGAAAAIAGALGLKATVVQPLSSTVPVSGTTGASVVLVVGPDLAPQVTAGTS
jgi:LytR cell envelope-related transcriptional attenuator